MRALIVDDEPVARRVLREELELVGGIEIVAEAENGDVALQQLSSLRPDLMFLDIEMPLMDGFELLARLNRGRLPAVVMVTAYDQYAIQAFEAGAIDYLLKPISQERLVRSLERARRIAKSGAEAAETIARLQSIGSTLKAADSSNRKIVGKSGDEYFLLSPQEVLAFQADGDLTWIITAKQRFLATQNLKALTERLESSSFRRIHRNALINIEQIRKMSSMSSQRWLITLTNGLEFIVSKRQAKNVRDVLEW
jgi:two-component system, LytTR family, response regulator